MDAAVDTADQADWEALERLVAAGADDDWLAGWLADHPRLIGRVLRQNRQLRFRLARQQKELDRLRLRARALKEEAATAATQVGLFERAEVARVAARRDEADQAAVEAGVHRVGGRALEL